MGIRSLTSTRAVLPLRFTVIQARSGSCWREASCRVGISREIAVGSFPYSHFRHDGEDFFAGYPFVPLYLYDPDALGQQLEQQQIDSGSDSQSGPSPIPA